ncbi:ERAP1-like C-terminal domain-containing protein, partial [Sinomonas sp. G460-2]|uniref:ERAP1-like C-terminal domain-containing protein n=1 Tax=Sinomonas sp. G460-2 TaxID=3393464 RepID=UPI0039EFA2BC
ATARGRVGYALAVAARPTAEAKHAAWNAVIESESLSNELLGATVEGFSLGPDSLRAAYRERYFALLERVWGERSNEIASRIVRGLFPSDESLGTGEAPEENALLLRTDSWHAAHAAAPAALRRIVTEQRDHLRRALAAQARSQRG